jgi:hypothetical protein
MATRSRLRLLVEATFAPGSERDGEIAEWCEDYTDHQATKLARLCRTHTPLVIRHEGNTYPVMITKVRQVDPGERDTRLHDMSPLVPVSRILGTYPDPEHLG